MGQRYQCAKSLQHSTCRSFLERKKVSIIDLIQTLFTYHKTSLGDSTRKKKCHCGIFIGIYQGSIFL